VFFISFLGELEIVMLESFIRQGRLHRWMSRDDCPESIRECSKNLDKQSRRADYSSSPSVAFPRDLASLIRCKRGSLHAYHRVGEIMFSRSSTHTGNSLIGYYPQGEATSPPVYGSIQYIFSIDGKVRFAARRHLPATVTFDRFVLYPHFPAKLFSSKMGGLEIVHLDWVIGHFARWRFNSDLVVALPLQHD